MCLSSPTLTGPWEHLCSPSLLPQSLGAAALGRSTGLCMRAHCCQSCPEGADLLQPQLAEETSWFSLLPLPSLEFSGYQATHSTTAAPSLFAQPRGGLMLFYTHTPQPCPSQTSICAACAERGIPAGLQEASSILRQSSNPNILLLIVRIFRSSITHYMLLMRPAESSDICLPSP